MFPGVPRSKGLPMSDATHTMSSGVPHNLISLPASTFYNWIFISHFNQGILLHCLILNLCRKGISVVAVITFVPCKEDFIKFTHEDPRHMKPKVSLIVPTMYGRSCCIQADLYSFFVFNHQSRFPGLRGFA